MYCIKLCASISAYVENVSMGSENYSENGDNNIREFVLLGIYLWDILIVSSMLYLVNSFLIRLAVKEPKLLQKLQGNYRYGNYCPR